MSRIGKLPVELPNNVTFNVADGQVSVKGPKGELSRKVAHGISFEQAENIVQVNRGGDTPRIRSNHGLMRALFANMVHGVSQGFERNLEIVGVGYKADVKGSSVVFNLGYSHPITFPFPKGITIAVDKGTRITVKGIDKEQVGQVAAELRGFRPPDSYKGKGVRYEGERIRLKAGKTAQ